MQQQNQPLSFYKKPLPNHLIPFSSSEGRKIFQEALNDGTMHGFFPLIEQFSTQQEPAYCGLSTLAQVLNALGIDPQRRWRGPWRWYDEALLDCCVPLETVQKQGISIEEFQCLARCNSVKCELVRPSPGDTTDEEIHRFRRTILDCMTEPVAESNRVEKHVVVSFDRGTLQQTGSGHFSPIGGYHRGKDLVLVLDSARFKYPPFWVDLNLLFLSLKPVDPQTNKSRGYLTLTKNENKSDLGATFCKIQPAYSWANLVSELRGTVEKLLSSDVSDLPSIVRLFAQLLENQVGSIIQPFEAFFSQSESNDSTAKDLSPNYREYVTKLFNEVQLTEIYSIIRGEVSHVDNNTEPKPQSASCSSCSCTHKNEPTSAPDDVKSILLTILFLGIPSEYFRQAQAFSDNAFTIKQIILSARDNIKCKSGCSSCFQEVNRIQLQIEAVTKCVDKKDL